MSQSRSTETVSSKSALDWAGLARSAGSRYGSTDGDDRPELLREFLVFGLDGAQYAIPVERVREIVRMRTLTRVPRSPSWLLGVVGLRGEVVEIIDLRARLRLDPSDPARTSRIIVLHGDGDHVTGILVDSVTEVFRVSEEAILPAQGLDASAVVEMCPRGSEFVSILDIDRALGLADE